MLRWYSWLPRILQTLAWLPTRVLLHIFCRFEVRGKSNLRGLPQAIFAVNHASELDPIILTAALSPLGRFSPMFYLTAPDKAFRHEKFGWRRYIYTGLFFKLWGAYAVPQGLRDYSKALIVHTSMLLQGASLCVFPEGSMTRTGAFGEPRGGLVHLSFTTGVPIVPVAISDSFHMTARDFLLRRRRLTLEFGSPIYPQMLHGGREISPTEYSALAKDVFQKIREMLETRGR